MLPAVFLFLAKLAVPSVVGDVPLLEVKLVEQCLPIEEVVEGL